ncbi:MAG TPA: hypothetical protein VM490_16600, partial [Armatimonadaceae bacterium]|nr:hypothetical protein [Armatimonadaceae bacterium]
PVGSLRRWMWVLAGIAAAINAAHGIEKDGAAAGLALGALSLLGVLLHSIRQGLDTAKAVGRNRGLEIWRRIRYPRLSLAAASIRAARELDQDAAWQLAWIDRFGVGPDASRRDRVLGALITDRELKEDRKAAKTGELTIIGGHVQRDVSADIREYIDAERAAARAEAEAVIDSAQDALIAAGLLFGPDTLTENTLGGRAAELLPALQDAIRNGDLPPTPGVKRIQAFVKDDLGHPSIGVPTAQELRNALSGIHAVPSPEHEQAAS